MQITKVLTSLRIHNALSEPLRPLVSMISKLATCKVLIFQLVSVAEQTGLSLTWSEAPKIGFLSTLTVWTYYNVMKWHLWSFLTAKRVSVYARAFELAHLFYTEYTYFSLILVWGAAGSSLTWGSGKTLFPLLSTGSTQKELSRYDWKIVDWDVKNQNK